MPKRSPGSTVPARVSKGEDEPPSAPSCFETHRSASRLWKELRSRGAALLLSMRAGEGGVFWRNGPTPKLRGRSEQRTNLWV